jgi:methionine-gamma-lyase
MKNSVQEALMSHDPVAALAHVRHEFGEHGGVNMSITSSSTFTVMQPETMPAIFGGSVGPEQGGCFLYGRHFNPTVYVLGRELAAIEASEAAYATASGMSAIASTLLQLCDRDDEIVASNTIYGGSFAFLKDYLPPKTGISTTFVDVHDLDAVRQAMSSRTKVLFVETISNPTLRVADLPALAAIAHAHGAKLVVDNTFAPLIVTPMEHGADVVVHSLTKFMGGASDLIAGCVCASTELISEMMGLHQGSIMLLGPTLDPKTAFTLSMRLPHLPLRIAEHGRRAQLFAERMQAMGLQVHYPGLAAHPDYEILRRLSSNRFGAGGVLAVDLGSQESAHRLMHILQNDEAFGFIAVSLGYHHTLMSCSASSTSSELDEDELANAGVSEGLLRISIGYTGDLESRWQAFERALHRSGVLGRAA